MKNFLFAFVAGCIPVLAITSEVKAQASNNITTIELPKHFLKLDMSVAPENDNTINMDAISIEAVKALKKSYEDLKKSYNAVKDFKTSNKAVSNAKWYKIMDGFAAEFTSNDISTRVLYNTDGKWSATIKNYGENKLPGTIRNIVKSEYRGYKINSVEEIETRQTRSTPTYIVHIEDDSTIKLIRVKGEETDVYKEFDKQ